jgi:hypothetical protein
MDAFNELYRRVISGEYAKPYLHGIEPMTRDHEGYIYYKDKQVEHYDNHYVHSLQAKRDLAELRNRCVYLERRGIEMSFSNIIWGWEGHKNAYGAEKAAALDNALTGGGITFSKVVVDNNWNDEITFFAQGVPNRDDVLSSAEFADFQRRCNNGHGYEVSVQTYRCGEGDETGNPEALALAASAFDYLSENKMLDRVKSQNYLVEPERGEYEDENEDELDDEMEDAL